MRHRFRPHTRTGKPRSRQVLLRFHRRLFREMEHRRRRRRRMRRRRARASAMWSNVPAPPDAIDRHRHRVRDPARPSRRRSPASRRRGRSTARAVRRRRALPSRARPRPGRGRCRPCPNACTPRRAVAVRARPAHVDRHHHALRAEPVRRLAHDLRPFQRGGPDHDLVGARPRAGRARRRRWSRRRRPRTA